ncbi:MAG: tRNA uridine-5-carboxymethylaminomethyl(34) synthesis enzyme MnmG, partial [Sarcina sp.]
EREREQIERFKRLEALSIAEDFDFDTVVGISNIARAGMKDIKPLSIGEASRISGVTGNDIALLLATLKK